MEDLANKYNLNFVGSIHKPIDLKDFDDIEVFYQPQVKLRNRKLVCVEALCRLRDHSLGLISPDKFIDKSEETDLIFHLTLNVIDKASTDWVAWYNQEIDITLSINSSRT